jgi:flagellar hook-associated protein 1 FlgK
MSLYTSLSIARQSLSVNQLAIQVTGQNIANVNTPGYKQQRVNQANLPYGLGVSVKSIERLLDPFAEARLLTTTTASKKADETSQAYKLLEDLFNDMSKRGLDAEFTDFFQSLQNLSQDPSGASERATLRAGADSMGGVFAFLYQQMEGQMKSQEVLINDNITKANQLIKSVAELNRQIAENLQNKIGINELRNDRDEYIRQLAEIMPVQVQEDAKGNFHLFLAGSMPLVAGAESYQLETRVVTTNQNKTDIFWVTESGTEQNVTDKMTSGQLGGAIAVRDEIVPAQMEKLDRLAAEFILKFNERHRAGTGLDGVSGRNFFEPTSVYAEAGKGTQGGVALTATVAGEAQLTLEDYELRFGAGGTFQLVSVTRGLVLTGGLYTPGMTLNFDGVQMTINNVSGPPQEGDFFEINTYRGAAARVRLSADVAASTDAIAAGFSPATGDNQNALLLADLENALIANNGTTSFRQKYQGILVEIGIGAAAANLESDSQGTLLSQIGNLVESTSGVNVDEEATRLMAYQRAYQAASRLVNVVDIMMDAMINLIR